MRISLFMDDSLSLTNNLTVTFRFYKFNYLLVDYTTIFFFVIFLLGIVTAISTRMV